MADPANYAVMIPTLNEEANLPYALASAVGRAKQVFVLDSGSSDKTESIARAAGADFVYQPWLGYAKQKNWGLDNLPITTPWVFILDADEVITPGLADELAAIANADSCMENGFYINRFFIFLGKRIRHCGYYPSWNLRFFRRGKARYEQRDVHEHMLVEGSTGYLKGEMEHNDRRGLEYYIAKHNRYSTLEAREYIRLRQLHKSGGITASPFGGPIARRRWVKEVIWPRLPARWVFRWLYMYVYRLGFLDGMTGFHFCFFLAAYEHQITLKMLEQPEMRQAAITPDAAGYNPKG